MHLCTDADYAKFHPVEGKFTGKLENLKKNSGLFCLDWKEYGHDIWGTWTNGATYGAMDIMAVPCGNEYTAYDGRIDGPSEDCNWDKDELISYLGGTFLLNIYYNEGVFDVKNFGKDKIKQQSSLKTVTVSSETPSWIQTSIE